MHINIKINPIRRICTDFPCKSLYFFRVLRSSSVSNSKEIPIVVATASGSCSEEELLENGFTACLFKPFSISELVAVSDKCLLTSTDKDELPDLSSLLAYGDKRAMLDRLITETEKDMQAVREIMERNDRKALDEWMHRQRSSWAVVTRPYMCILLLPLFVRS